MDGACLIGVIQKDRVRETERGKKFEQVGLGIDLRLIEDAVFQCGFEDFLLSLLSDEGFEVRVGFGEHAGLPVVHV